jgi:hypothetical protein
MVNRSWRVAERPVDRIPPTIRRTRVQSTRPGMRWSNGRIRLRVMERAPTGEAGGRATSPRPVAKYSHTVHRYPSMSGREPQSNVQTRVIRLSPCLWICLVLVLHFQEPPIARAPDRCFWRRACPLHAGHRAEAEQHAVHPDTRLLGITGPGSARLGKTGVTTARAVSANVLWAGLAWFCGRLACACLH